MKYVGHKRRIVSDEEARAIRQSDKSLAELAREYGYARSTISRVKSDK